MLQRLFFTLLILILPFLSQAQNAPLEFVQNKGQWDGPFLFKAVSSNGDIFLEENGFSFVIGEKENLSKIHAHNPQPQTLKFHVYRMRLHGAGKADEIKGEKKQSHYYNYFYGNDSTRWKTGLHPFLAVDYKNIYPAVDLHVASEQGSLKYDFIVRPGGKAGDIAFSFEGLDGLSISKGDLVMKTSVGVVRELAPYAFQYVGGERKKVPCKFVLKRGVVRFDFPDGFDSSVNLIIDPTVVFATFTGSTADNWGFTATYDAQGNFYAGGIVHHFSPQQAPSPGNYPTTTGAYQVTYGGGSTLTGSFYPCDMAISKFNATGTTLLYSTYLGGADNEQPHSLIVDPQDNLIIGGKTYSSDFPVTPTAFDNTYNGSGDIVVVKLNAAGTALIGSTFLGGSDADGVNYNADEFAAGELKHNFGDDARSEVMIDATGNIYLVASTFSTDFPVTFNAHQPLLQGGQDGVLVKLNNNLTSMIYGTYLGGSAADAAYVVALDNNQTHIYVGGGTRSTNFPTTGGTLWPTYQGGYSDGYIAKFLNSGSYNLQKVTFIGRNKYDQVYGLQVDLHDNVYAVGQTLGGKFPVSPNTYVNPHASQFIIKLDSGLTTNLVSSVFGSGDSNKTNISPVAFLVDSCENIYVSGWGGNIGFPSSQTGNVLHMPITPNAMQSSTDGNDFYFVVFTKNLQSLLYGTYAGTAGGVCEHVDGGTSRFDKRGVVYQAICGGCGGGTFPTTPGVWSPTNGSANCNLVALKIAFEFINPFASAKTTSDTIGCAPFVVQFDNQSTNALSYEWDFGDGSPPDTSKNPKHTFFIPGTYNVRLIAFNMGSCKKTSDTDYFRITVDSSSIKARFDQGITNLCDSLLVTFSNTSIYNTKTGSAATAQFYWDFGDGTFFTGKNPPIHIYRDTGTYIVTLKMVDTTSCNKRDSVSSLVVLASDDVHAAFLFDTVCVGAPVNFSNQSSAAQVFLWDFGNGDTSLALAPQYSFDTAGTYTVTLIAQSLPPCAKADTISHEVKVWPKPSANFSYSPIIPIPNEPIVFQNLSDGATSFYWGFGDGKSSTEVNPSHLYHRTGRYKVCLQAQNSFGCMDQICRYVDAEIYPAIGVPTGFTPNGDGSNDILYVRGAAIETVHFRVYNRWGEKVFETDDIEVGWDGTFKGQPQEMDSYAWILEATFIDGTSAHERGNVTLIR